MQLILNTGTTVDIKAKMSLNEDNLEKGTLDVHSAVANGDVANSDTPNEDNGANDSNKKLEQVKQNSIKPAECELQVTTDDISNNADTETSHDNELNQAVDIVNGKDDIKNNDSVEGISKVNENTSSELVNKETENVDNEITDTKVTDINTIAVNGDEEQNDSGSDITTKVNEINTIAVIGESIPIEGQNDRDSDSATKVNEINTIAVEAESIHIEVQNESGSDSAVTKLNHESHADVTMADDVNENICTEKENNDIVDNNKEAESTDEKITVTSIADENERFTVEAKETVNTDVELDDGDCAGHKITDTTESVTIEKETNYVDLDTKTEVNSINASADITDDHDENGSNTCNVHHNENANSNIIVDNVDHEDGGTAKKHPAAELNVANSSLEEREKVSVLIENIQSPSEEQKEDVDVMPEIDSTVNSTNGEEKIDSDEGVSIGVRKENILNADTNSEVSKNIPDSVEKIKMETDENDMSDESIDLINLNVKQENEDVLECVKKELDEEERRINDIDEKETLKALLNDDASRKPDLMDVDESEENVKVTVEANSEASPISVTDVNSSKNTLTVDCNINEPVSVLKDESVNLAPDSSDDVIFNVDDDKEQQNELVKPKVSEFTKVVEDDNKPVSSCDDGKKISDSISVPKQSDEIIDLDENVLKDTTGSAACQENTPNKIAEVPKIPPVLKLSNTLDILSDEEDEPKETNADSKCINIEDDDDVMLIDEDTCGNEIKTEPTKEIEKENQEEPKPKSPVANMELSDESVKIGTEPTTETETTVPETQVIESIQKPEISEKVKELSPEKEITTPLLHEKFLKTCKKNLSEMTREELEEFCILKIVESVIDRSSLSEVKNKLKTLTQNKDEFNKKAKMLTKQNRDLQVVLKSIQEDQKKGVDSIVPLKITRSVGMQVLMTDKVVQRRKGIGLPSNAPVNKQLRNPVIQSPRPQKQQAPQIPVPRLVPANNPTLKSPNTQQPNTGKITSPLPNGIKNASPVQKAEKRTHNRIQSVTVDLTDDEPPAKVVNRAQTPAVPPVRLVPSQNLLAPPRPTTVNSPRKVYIPISGPQGQNVRAGQTIMLKTVPAPNTRQRCPPPHMVRMPQTMRMQRPQGLRHPAPLPDCMKQYQPPNWKALPPAPDLKLAKVENGIVISWKIEGYQEDSYEEIASYQLYAYQETASPPSTALWKKIGDVKALPLPMACTLTQFMAGYKYYFAVRAVDIRSRLGPFSLPGSILLLNKM